MEKKQIIEDMTAVFRNCEGNVISGEIALEGCEGLVMFEEPVFGVSSADDSIYREFLKKDVIGSDFRLPDKWLPGARSVISFFLPFTEQVRRSNRGTPEETSPEWLHARIEGQAFLNSYTERLRSTSKNAERKPASLLSTAVLPSEHQYFPLGITKCCISQATGLKGMWLTHQALVHSALPAD